MCVCVYVCVCVCVYVCVCVCVYVCVRVLSPVSNLVRNINLVLLVLYNFVTLTTLRPITTGTVESGGRLIDTLLSTLRSDYIL